MYSTTALVPDRSPVIEYITEEVWRQAHDVTGLDGIERVGFMTEAWAFALRRARMGDLPDVTDVLAIGRMVEPMMNKNGFRTINVRIGGRPAGSLHGTVKADMDELFKRRDALTPMEFYLQFEKIHPFGDGNGRTGKVLLNWLNKTLLRPVFPPADLFGEPIINP